MPLILLLWRIEDIFFQTDNCNLCSDGVIFPPLKVFGTKKALWFLPLFSKEDLDNIPALHGLDFPIRSDV